MNSWFAKAVILLATVVMIVIRAPHGQRSRRIRVTKNCKGALEIVLLTIAWLTFFVPLVWIVAPVLAFAEYPLHPVPLVAGTVCTALGLWLFHRSHADLGTNWSITLQVREKHRLVTEGLYRHVRHPMYLALLVYSAGHALVIPNYVVGPANVVAMILIVAFRLRPEERMMLDQFGKDYEAYRERTRRLVPGIW